MPAVIDYIDKIAREKQRDVLYVIFFSEKTTRLSDDDYRPFLYKECAIRQTLLEWFERNGITVYPCGPFSRGKAIESSYRGQLYIDLPFDKNNPDYQKVKNLLEHEDGTMKLPGVQFCYLPLEAAMEYAYSDEPGYWDKYWDDIDLQWNSPDQDDKGDAQG